MGLQRSRFSCVLLRRARWVSRIDARVSVPNFGVATSFEYRLHPVGPMLAGRLVYPIAQAKEVFQIFHEITQTAPDELTGTCTLRTSPDGAPVAAVTLCYNGPLDAGEAVVQPLRQIGTAIADLVRPMTYLEVQSLIDPLYPPGLCQYWKSSFLQELGDEAIDTIATKEQIATIPR
jgi:hypothetical protein